MQDRLKAAVDGKVDEEFFIMARTDAIASEGIDGAIERWNLILKRERMAYF